MPFSIRLLPARTRPRLGEIRIESFVERFAVHRLAGSIDDVAAAWHVELHSLLDGADAVGLPTAPNIAWLLYRFDMQVLVHQVIIVDGWEGELAPDGRITRVPDYRSVSEDGHKISEWETSLEAVRAFAAG